MCSALSETDKKCIEEVFIKFEQQKAEIENLSVEVNKKVKEFAEILKEEFDEEYAYSFESIEKRINNLVKEMVGDTE